MNRTLVIFDLDGTLIDTAPDLIDSLNHTIGLKGLDALSFDDLTHIVGHGARAMIERAFLLREVELSMDEIPHLQEIFIAHYQQRMPGKSQPYPGLIPALDRLCAAGYKLAICTNKMEALARRLISDLGLQSRFSAITGGDTFLTRKPDAGHILGTIHAAGGTLERSVMIGDNLNDILSAKNAAIPSIAVPFGYSDVPVSDLAPDHIIGHFDELTVKLIERLISKT